MYWYVWCVWKRPICILIRYIFGMYLFIFVYICFYLYIYHIYIYIYCIYLYRHIHLHANCRFFPFTFVAFKSSRTWRASWKKSFQIWAILGTPLQKLLRTLSRVASTFEAGKSVNLFWEFGNPWKAYVSLVLDMKISKIGWIWCVFSHFFLVLGGRKGRLILIQASPISFEVSWQT